ncbi:hypothetical protein [Xylanimonas protaetiae]|uniref:hypothetical protein n=1 Tax=Xylanimonas protaetiae TaxID=2509457 RepID=UPI00315A1E5B
MSEVPDAQIASSEPAASPAPRWTRYVAVGDSFSEGCGTRTRRRRTTSTTTPSSAAGPTGSPTPSRRGA